MIGAIVGDMVGSRFEFNNYKSKFFKFWSDECSYTDDSVMTCAVAEALMRSWKKDKFETLEKVAKETIQDIGFWYPFCGYGGRFIKWMYSVDPKPYNSCGNGSAMRISAVGDLARSVDEAKRLARAVTVISHDHEEGIKGAEAVAVAIYLLRNGMGKNELRRYIQENYYDVSAHVDELRKKTDGHGKEICQITVPQAFVCFFEGYSFRDVIRNCVSIGGDTDTISAIAGALAEAYYGVPEKERRRAMMNLPIELEDIYVRFEEFKRMRREEKTR